MLHRRAFDVTFVFQQVRKVKPESDFYGMVSELLFAAPLWGKWGIAENALGVDFANACLRETNSTPENRFSRVIPCEDARKLSFPKWLWDSLKKGGTFIGPINDFSPLTPANSRKRAAQQAGTLFFGPARNCQPDNLFKRFIGKAGKVSVRLLRRMNRKEGNEILSVEEEYSVWRSLRQW